MVVATMQLTGFVGEMDRDTVLSHYHRLVDDGLVDAEAITQTLEAIVHSSRAVDFVRAFGVTAIRGMTTTRAAKLHPASYTSPRWKPEPVQLIDRASGDGHADRDTHGYLAAPLAPEPIRQVFPEHGQGRVVNVAALAKSRVLEGVLSGTWSVDGVDVPLGLLTAAQCFKLSESETRAGRSRMANGTMFRRLGESLKPGEMVADRWDDARVNTLFELSEPKL